MNLLLLLSALLSALTGVGAGVRQPPATQAVAQHAGQVAAIVPARAATVRPAQAAAPLVAIAIAPIAAAWVLAPGEPLFSGRRRE